MLMPSVQEQARIRVAASDEDQARELLLRHEGRVHRLVARLLGPDPEHEDIVQDVFVRLMTSSRSLRELDKEAAWVSIVTVNLVRNHLRRRRVRRIVETRADPPEVASSSEDAVTDRDLAIRGYRLLDALAPRDRIIMLLRRGEGRPIREVAEMCSCSPATVKRRLARAERRLQAALDADPDLRAGLEERGWLA